MAKIWNPGARKETVAAFLRDWCVREPGRHSRVEALFGGYEVYCRKVKQKDLTLGEFNAEMERLGFRQVQHFGSMAWEGLSLTFLEDGLVGRQYGARYREE